MFFHGKPSTDMPSPERTILNQVCSRDFTLGGGAQKLWRCRGGVHIFEAHGALLVDRTVLLCYVPTKPVYFLVKKIPSIDDWGAMAPVPPPGYAPVLNNYFLTISGFVITLNSDLSPQNIITKLTEAVIDNTDGITKHRFSPYDWRSLSKL